MEKKPKNKWLSFLADGMLSGLMIGIGCVVSMSCENRYLGAFLFSLGLFCIVQFQYGLYTGKVGYIFDRDKHIWVRRSSRSWRMPSAQALPPASCI